jgi:hypothetical protein
MKYKKCTTMLQQMRSHLALLPLLFSKQLLLFLLEEALLLEVTKRASRKSLHVHPEVLITNAWNE